MFYLGQLKLARRVNLALASKNSLPNWARFILIHESGEKLEVAGSNF